MTITMIAVYIALAWLSAWNARNAAIRQVKRCIYCHMPYALSALSVRGQNVLAQLVILAIKECHERQDTTMHL